jgi:hypothetical protein
LPGGRRRGSRRLHYSLAALPVLTAIYLMSKAARRPRFITVIAAGVMIGLSCWLRSNALVLAPFLAAVVLPVMLKYDGLLK